MFLPYQDTFHINIADSSYQALSDSQNESGIDIGAERSVPDRNAGMCTIAVLVFSWHP
jgi:hypothetical protein